MKVLIEDLPEGFYFKNVPKAKKGGKTGNQSNYQLVQYPNSIVDFSTKKNVRHTLSAVPKDEANLEAEGGETVLTDLNNDGLFNLYTIKGPRHSSGGVPLNLPDESFVFSDTQSLKLSPKELSEFNIKSRKKITPAKVSKKYDLNNYFAAIQDEFADDIKVRSAELMMDKNRMGLSKLAFMQELKKNFSDGVPSTAYPFLLSNNIDPFEFINSIKSNKSFKAQQGIETGNELIGEPAKDYNTKLPPNNGLWGNVTPNDFNNWLNAWRATTKEGDQLVKILDDIEKTVNQYKFEENPYVTKFQKWYDESYLPAKVRGLSNQGQNYTPEQQAQLLEEYSNMYGFSRNKNNAKKDGKLGPYTLGHLPLGINTQIGPEITIQPEESEYITYDTPFGPSNYTPPFVPPDYTSPKNNRLPPKFWLQDAIKTAAIASRNRDKFFPWQPPISPIDINYTLEDPTRAIAAINEQLGMQTNAIGAFAGPQSINARVSQMQGEAASQIANEIARVNQRNVNTINRAESQQAQIDMILDAERRKNLTKEYDDTQEVLQNYMDERNFDREQLAEAISSAMTNRANTYNLNQLQDYFQIDPTTGGTIGKFGERAFNPVVLEDRSEKIVKAIEKLKELGITNPSPELIQYFLTNSETNSETNLQREYKSMNPQRKKGGIIPFYIGKIGN